MHIGRRRGEAPPGTVPRSSNHNPSCWTALLTFTPGVEQKVDGVVFRLVNVRSSLHAQAVFSHRGISRAGDGQQALGR